MLKARWHGQIDGGQVQALPRSGRVSFQGGELPVKASQASRDLRVHSEPTLPLGL